MHGKNIIKRYDSMNSNVIGNWMNLWQECADWCFPTNDNINRIRVAGQEKPPQRMIDTCIEANYSFASGFFSHMFPPNTVWAKFRHPSPMMMANKNVANYFEEVSRIAHKIIIESNFTLPIVYLFFNLFILLSLASSLKSDFSILAISSTRFCFLIL